MKRNACSFGFGILLCLAITSISLAQSAGGSADIARGKYLVEQVSLCGDCHTPHNEKGEPIQAQLLKGATVPYKPAVPTPVFADKAPNIAGLRGWEEADAIKFFMTGIAYNDLPARPPMPQYRFSKEDAAAVTAYLKSLSPAGKPAAQGK